MTTLPGPTLPAPALGRPDPGLRGPTPAYMEGFLQAPVPHHSRASCRKRTLPGKPSIFWNRWGQVRAPLGEGQNPPQLVVSPTPPQNGVCCSAGLASLNPGGELGCWFRGAPSCLPLGLLRGLLRHYHGRNSQRASEARSGGGVASQPPTQAWRRASSHRRLWRLPRDHSPQQCWGDLSGAWGLGRLSSLRVSSRPSLFGSWSSGVAGKAHAERGVLCHEGAPLQ